MRDHSLRDSRSDQSSNFSDESSPKFKRSSKFNLIKNIKLDTIKRPSAQAIPPNSTNVAGMGPTGATLVGYKKIDHDTSAPIVELGTLSPVQPLSNKRFTIAASMPSLGGPNNALLNLSGSMPDLNRSMSLKQNPRPNLFGTSIEEGSTVTRTKLENDLKLGEESPQTTETSDIQKATPISLSGSDSSLNEDAIQNGYLPSDSSKHSSPPVHESKEMTDMSSLTVALRDAENSKQRDSDEVRSISGISIETSETKHTEDSGVVSLTDGSTLTVDSVDSTHVLSTRSSSAATFSECKERAGQTQGAVSSQSSEHSANNNSNKVLQSRDSETYLTGECTLMELLNEEFERSREVTGEKKYLKSAVESTISSTPRKGTDAKAEKGTKLGIGAKQLLGGPKDKEGLHPSSSSPELYELSSERSKFLVSPVPDKTIK